MASITEDNRNTHVLFPQNLPLCHCQKKKSYPTQRHIKTLRTLNKGSFTLQRINRPIFINIFLSDLINTPRLLRFDTFSGPRPTIQTPSPPPSPLTLHCKEYLFPNQGGPCNYWVRGEEKKPKTFGLMCRGGRLWSIAGS